MTVNGKPIAIFTCMQLVAAFLSYAGGKLGGRLVTKLWGEGELGPSITMWLDRLGLLPVLIPLIWFGLVLFRSQRNASNLEMLCWWLSQRSSVSLLEAEELQPHSRHFCSRQ